MVGRGTSRSSPGMQAMWTDRGLFCTSRTSWRRPGERRGTSEDQNSRKYLYITGTIRKTLSPAARCCSPVVSGEKDCWQPDPCVSGSKPLGVCAALTKLNRCLIGFLLSLTPLSCDLMGWRGAGEADGSASIGAYLFFGGLLMNLGAVGEVSSGILCGRMRSCVDQYGSSSSGTRSLRSSSRASVSITICGSTMTEADAGIGAFWLTYGVTLQPFYSASANYALADGMPASMGSTDPHFLNAFGEEAFASREATLEHSADQTYYDSIHTAVDGIHVLHLPDRVAPDQHGLRPDLPRAPPYLRIPGRRVLADG